LNTSALTDWRHHSLTTDPPIKEEPSYSSGTGLSHPLMTPESPSLKRRRSDGSQDMGEKRQRVDSGSSANKPAGDLPGGGFNTMLAQVEGAVMQQYAPSGIELAYGPHQAGQSCSLAAQNEHTEPQSQSNGFMSDPHLYMRILSLPILESLVRRAPPNGKICPCLLTDI
jgi:hypothetical protein